MSIEVCTGDYEILTPSDFLRHQLRIIEDAGRTCYQSGRGKEITEATAKDFVHMIINNTHESVVEHTIITVRFTGCSRGFTHELVRHRLSSFSQESTRYVDYLRDEKKGRPMRVVAPPEREEKYMAVFNDLMEHSQSAYVKLRDLGYPAEDARQVLTTGLVSEIVKSANFRQWRRVFELRCDKPAHWEIRGVMNRLLVDLNARLPGVFDDFVYAGECKRGIPYYVKLIPKKKLEEQLRLRGWPLPAEEEGK